MWTDSASASGVRRFADLPVWDSPTWSANLAAKVGADESTVGARAPGDPASALGQFATLA